MWEGVVRENTPLSSFVFVCRLMSWWALSGSAKVFFTFRGFSPGRWNFCACWSLAEDLSALPEKQVRTARGHLHSASVARADPEDFCHTAAVVEQWS